MRIYVYRENTDEDSNYRSGGGGHLSRSKSKTEYGPGEAQAKAEGYDVAVCHNIKPNRPEYLCGQEMVTKGI